MVMQTRSLVCKILEMVYVRLTYVTLSFAGNCRGQYVYSCGRSSVIWDMQPSALKANISTRVSQLAEPKKSPPQHEEQR